MNVTAVSIILAGVLGMASGGASAASTGAREARHPGTAIQVAQDRQRGRGRGNHILGRAHVHEGDVIEIRGERIRLFGIDAFQRGQRCRNNRGKGYRCGRRARFALARKIEGQQLACVRRGRSRHGTLATCWLAAEDVAAWMVLSGWAVASEGPGGAYSIHERMARRGRVNAWSGEFDRPSAWRKPRRDRPRRRRERDD
jgi:endonuclease YncB( thermonuclease family)